MRNDTDVTYDLFMFVRVPKVGEDESAKLPLKSERAVGIKAW
jgi:hypothetical protein